MKFQTHQSSPPFDEKISHQLENMLASQDFNATPQQSALLKYVVVQTLTGNADQIKGYTVATEVFGRKADFDQNIDPIVSIQASRLRQALDRYYETAGKNDPIRIDIPKGSYVPIFSEQLSDDQQIVAEQTAPVYDMAAWPTVLVRPLANLTDHAEDNYLSIGLRSELAHAIGHYQEIRVLEAPDRDQKSASLETDPDFVIDGNIRRDSTGIKVVIKLHDTTRGLQVWSGKYQGNLEAAKMVSFQEEVAAEVAVRIAGGNAAIHRHLAVLSRNKVVPNLTTYEAMLHYWESATLLTAPSMLRAFRALEHALAREPDNGQVCSMLASLYANNYGLELVDLPTPLEKAVELAQKGVNLAPTCRRARAILAYVCFMENKLQQAQCEAEKALTQYSCSLMYLDVIGCLISLLGEWERGVNYIKKAIQINPNYRPWVRLALVFNWFRVGDYEGAYRESLHFMLPELFWDPLLKASASGQLGKIEEGQAYVSSLLALKPDFTQRGRTLIRRYVQFEDIVERLIKGLNAVGVEVR